MPCLVFSSFLPFFFIFYRYISLQECQNSSFEVFSFALHYLHFLSFFLLCLPWGLSWILEAFFKYLATFGCLLLTQEHNRGDWTPGPGVGKASRMPGTPHLKEHTYIQSCASAMWVVSALQVSASLRISLWCPGVCCEWPCRAIGLQFRRVVRKSIKLCAQGHRCLYVKIFSQGRCRFSSERSFTHLRKNKPGCHAGAG